MIQAAALARVIGELDQELVLYRALFELLQEQYRCAALADDAALRRTCDALTAQLALLETRRQTRNPNLLGVVALFSRDDRHASGAELTLQARCRELKRLALSCRSLCVRNGDVLAANYESLQRVLHGEMHTYDPA